MSDEKTAWQLEKEAHEFAWRVCEDINKACGAFSLIGYSGLRVVLPALQNAYLEAHGHRTVASQPQTLTQTERPA